MDTNELLFGSETSKEPREWLQRGKTLVTDGRPMIPTEEQRQKYNDWCNENCAKPGFNYAVTADSMGLEVRDRNEYISLGMLGRLDAAKLREFVAKCSDDLPDIESLEELEEDENIREPEENIKGLLHKGSKMVIGGPSKAKKTWLLMDLAQSISTGTKWLDVFETKQGRVLYVNLEIHKPFARKRMLAIKKAKGIENTNGNLDMLNLRGHAAPAEELIPKIMRKARRGNYSAIIIDPTYKVLGDRDENSAGDITDMLNEFEKLAAKLSVSVIFVAHFAKGNSNRKEVIDRISGSGVFARDPDTIMMMTEVDKTGRKPKKRKADKKGPDFKYGPFLVFLSKQGLTSGEWGNQAVKNELVKNRDGFQRKLSEMKKEGLVPEESDENKLYTLTEKGVQYLLDWDAQAAIKAEDILDEGDDNDDTLETANGRGILCVDFILRNHPPQPPIGIQFGDWEKGDCVFHKVELPAQTKDTDNNEVTCTEDRTGSMVKVTCNKCNHTVEGHFEKKAKPGDTTKHCLATMCEECPLGEQNRYVIGPDKVYNTFTYVITEYGKVTEDNVDEIAAQLKTTPEDAWRCWEKLNRKHEAAGL
jgi:AAA domain